MSVPRLNWSSSFSLVNGWTACSDCKVVIFQLIWDQLVQRGVRIIDVRDEGAAIHMAHAHAVLTGQLGVALVTAGPGVTNCVTAVANADLERASVLLIGGCPPRPQDDLGPLQGVPRPTS